LVELPLAERRAKLERFAARRLKGNPFFHLSDATEDIAKARRWLDRPGSFVDGIIAKQRHLPYASGERTGMQKFKRIRTADCVVGGFRYAERERVVGSLLLGLYDGDLLHHVGFTSSFKAADRKALLQKLKPLIQRPGFTGRAPGGPSRWSTKRTSEWEPLRPTLVVEVAFDHVTGDRFRHGTKFIRWRPDKAPRQCTFEQLKAPR
jgi:ATP-dependent DNA ligase